MLSIGDKIKIGKNFVDCVSGKYVSKGEIELLGGKFFVGCNTSRMDYVSTMHESETYREIKDIMRKNKIRFNFSYCAI
jgi:hypothetical protein